MGRDLLDPVRQGKVIDVQVEPLVAGIDRDDLSKTVFLLQRLPELDRPSLRFVEALRHIDVEIEFLRQEDVVCELIAWRVRLELPRSEVLAVQPLSGGIVCVPGGEPGQPASESLDVRDPVAYLDD